MKIHLLLGLKSICQQTIFHVFFVLINMCFCVYKYMVASKSIPAEETA